MAILNIPVDTADRDYSFSVELEGASYIFRMRHNSREDYWYYDLFDLSGAAIQTGRKLNTNFELTRLLDPARRFPGRLFLIDPSNQGLPATATTLGKTLLLTYAEAT